MSVVAAFAGVQRAHAGPAGGGGVVRVQQPAEGAPLRCISCLGVAQAATASSPAVRVWAEEKRRIPCTHPRSPAQVSLNLESKAKHSRQAKRAALEGVQGPAPRPPRLHAASTAAAATAADVCSARPHAGEGGGEAKRRKFGHSGHGFSGAPPRRSIPDFAGQIYLSSSSLSDSLTSAASELNAQRTTRTGRGKRATTGNL